MWKWLVLIPVVLLAIGLGYSIVVFVRFRRLAKVPLSIVPCVIWIFSIPVRHRRLVRAFGSRWYDNADLIRLRDGLLVFLMRGHYLYKRGDLAAYADLLYSAYGWVPDASGLKDTQDKGWLSLLWLLNKELEWIRSVETKSDSLSMRDLDKATFSAGLAHRTLMQIQKRL